MYGKHAFPFFIVTINHFYFIFHIKKNSPRKKAALPIVLSSLIHQWKHREIGNEKGNFSFTFS
jgi:hypothetical protein